MGFNKCYIPKERSLKKEYIKIGMKKFINKYSKCDVIIPGNIDNDYFLKEILTYEKRYIPIWYEIKIKIKKIRKYVLRSKSKV